ncbi:MAG TPA: portal protein [Geminicoccaceae bacterium]|nr:portal protein [Geminicoccaceae bacterium]
MNGARPAAGSESEALDLIRWFERLASARQGEQEPVWEEIAERVLPRQQFTGQRRLANSRDLIFDSTAPLALDRFAAAMESMLTPRGSTWHGLKPRRPELAERPTVSRYLDQVTKTLFALRSASRANFYGNLHEHYLSLGAFGTGAVSAMDEMGRALVYRAIPLADLFIDEDASGRVDAVFRRFSLTARQAIGEYGEDAPPKCREAVDRQPDRRFAFLHCVVPNDAARPGRAGPDGMPWRAVHVSVDDRLTIRAGGFRTMPYAVSRYVTGPGELYGRSPAFQSLADIKMVNRMSRTTINQANRATEPPLLATDDTLPPPLMIPNAVNAGWLDRNGNPRIRPFETGARFEIAFEVLEQRRRSINDAFLVSLFQILVETPSMTATEAMLRAQEKGALLAPTMGRQQAELVGPLIQRELDIAEAAGLLPPMPRELVDDGGFVEVDYLSPMARMQRNEEATGLLRTLEAAGPLAEIDPSVLEHIDAAKALRVLARANGVESLLRDDKEAAARIAQRLEQQQAQQMAAAAPGVARATRDIAEAGAVSQEARP